MMKHNIIILKSYSNNTYFQKPGTIGMWVAYDPESNTLIIDTEGLLGKFNYKGNSSFLDLVHNKDLVHN